jgi:hypothetical protein
MKIPVVVKSGRKNNDKQQGEIVNRNKIASRLNLIGLIKCIKTYILI